MARIAPTVVVVPTVTGYSARMVSRFKLPVWIAGVSREDAACQGLLFSYGVFPVHVPGLPSDWDDFVRSWMRSEGLPDGLVVLTGGPSRDNQTASYRLEIIDLRGEPRREEKP